MGKASQVKLLTVKTKSVKPVSRVKKGRFAKTAIIAVIPKCVEPVKDDICIFQLCCLSRSKSFIQGLEVYNA
jgi:glutamine phosphoribosylpyrophosphate amidotransferase